MNNSSDILISLKNITDGLNSIEWLSKNPKRIEEILHQVINKLNNNFITFVKDTNALPQFDLLIGFNEISHNLGLQNKIRDAVSLASISLYFELYQLGIRKLDFILSYYNSEFIVLRHFPF